VGICKEEHLTQSHVWGEIRKDFPEEVASEGCCVGEDAWEGSILTSVQSVFVQKPRVKILVHLETLK